MSKHKVMCILVRIGLVFLLFASSTLQAQERREKVLILHSYHQGLEWTDNVTRGILSQLRPLHKKYEIYFDYLDTKRNQGQRYWQSVTELMYLKHQHVDYALVIAVDNNALRFVNQNINLFSAKTQIIFCGINNYHKNLISNLTKVAGVPEEIDFQASLALMAKLHPKQQQVLVIHDQTATGLALKEKFAVDSKPFQQRFTFSYYTNFSLTMLARTVTELTPNTLIYLLPVNIDKDNSYISYNESIELINSNATVPIYSPWQMFLGKGIVGGEIISGFEQGKAAAKLALVKLTNTEQVQHTNTIELVKARTENIFDYKKLEQHNIDRELLPANAKIINTPNTWYQKYGTVIEYLVTALIILFLLLSWQNLQQRKALKAKLKTSQQLENMVKQRTQELAKANKELQALSNIDGLTQLYNRRYFDENLSKELNRAKRQQTHLALIMCDIDYFKKYNDYYGHLAGDDCIKQVAKILQSFSQRSSDIAARFGGEEFCLVLPNTCQQEAFAIAEQIQAQLTTLAIAHQSSPLIPIVTISIGLVADIPSRKTSMEQLISAADQALYQSKSQGRNQISIHNLALLQVNNSKKGA